MITKEDSIAWVRWVEWRPCASCGVHVKIVYESKTKTQIDKFRLNHN